MGIQLRKSSLELQKYFKKVLKTKSSKFFPSCCEIRNTRVRSLELRNRVLVETIYLNNFLHAPLEKGSPFKWNMFQPFFLWGDEAPSLKWLHIKAWNTRQKIRLIVGDFFNQYRIRTIIFYIECSLVAFWNNIRMFFNSHLINYS